MLAESDDKYMDNDAWGLVWSQCSDDLDGGDHANIRADIVMNVLEQSSEFQRRINKQLQCFPFRLAYMVMSHPTTVCQKRKEVAAAIVEADEARGLNKCHTTRKLRKLFLPELQSAARDGTLHGDLFQLLFNIFLLLFCDTQEVEGANNILRRCITNAPHISIGLLSSRLSIKKLLAQCETKAQREEFISNSLEYLKKSSAVSSSKGRWILEQPPEAQREHAAKHLAQAAVSAEATVDGRKRQRGKRAEYPQPSLTLRVSACALFMAKRAARLLSEPTTKSVLVVQVRKITTDDGADAVQRLHGFMASSKHYSSLMVSECNICFRRRQLQLHTFPLKQFSLLDAFVQLHHVYQPSMYAHRIGVCSVEWLEDSLNLANLPLAATESQNMVALPCLCQLPAEARVRRPRAATASSSHGTAEAEEHAHAADSEQPDVADALQAYEEYEKQLALEAVEAEDPGSYDSEQAASFLQELEEMDAAENAAALCEEDGPAEVKGEHVGGEATQATDGDDGQYEPDSDFHAPDATADASGSDHSAGEDSEEDPDGVGDGDGAAVTAAAVADLHSWATAISTSAKSCIVCAELISRKSARRAKMVTLEKSSHAGPYFVHWDNAAATPGLNEGRILDVYPPFSALQQCHLQYKTRQQSVLGLAAKPHNYILNTEVRMVRATGSMRKEMPNDIVRLRDGLSVCHAYSSCPGANVQDVVHTLRSFPRATLYEKIRCFVCKESGMCPNERSIAQ